jgi:hypothetical protein
MIKLRYVAIILCLVCFCALPSSGFAKMTRMSDMELDQITAQAGFSDMLGIMHINHDQETGTYYFGGKEGGYLSLADTSYEGTIGIDPSMTTRIVTTNGATGFECDLNGPVVNIRNFQTTVRLGTEIGAGQALGTMYIERLIVDVHGTMRVMAR